MADIHIGGTPGDDMDDGVTLTARAFFIGIIVFMVATTAAVVFVRWDANNKAAEIARAAAEERDVLSSGLEALRQEFVQATGREPVTDVNISEIVGPPGPPGPGPTDEQVRRAVEAYLEANPPEPGRPPTDAEVDAAVAAFCAARDDCSGPRGQQGVQGDQGVQGSRGEPGPGPSDDQVAEAVAEFCASNNGCVGPPGPQGPQGVTGPPPFVIGPWSYPCNVVSQCTTTCTLTSEDPVAYECATEVA